MTAEVLQQVIWPIVLAAAGLILAILGGATAIVRSHAKMVEQTNHTIAAREEAAAAAAKAQSEANVEREKMFNSMVTEMRGEVTLLRAQDQEKEHKIRELLEKLAELPKLELNIERLRAELNSVRAQLDEVRQAREEREQQLAAANQRANTAETKQKELEKLLIKEKNERVAEREGFNRRVNELESKIEMHESRMGTVEARLGTNEVAAAPEVSQ